LGGLTPCDTRGVWAMSGACPSIAADRGGAAGRSLRRRRATIYLDRQEDYFNGPSVYFFVPAPSFAVASPDEAAQVVEDEYIIFPGAHGLFASLQFWSVKTFSFPYCRDDIEFDRTVVELFDSFFGVVLLIL
jgi:hypothetical protein